MANPLLSASKLPHGAVPFHKVRTEHYLPALKAAIAAAQQKIADIKSSGQAPHFTNTIEALEVCSEKVDWISGVFFSQLSAETNKELQTLAQEFGPLLSSFSSDIMLDSEIFSRVKAVYDRKESENLNQEQWQLLENTYLDFVRNGALLSREKKDELREIDQRLSRLSPKFAENLLNATNAFELWLSRPEELSGLPQDAIDAARAAGKERQRPGECLFTLQAPSYLPFMQYADHRPSRERLLKAHSELAYGGDFDNQPLVKDIVSLRMQRAQLLGYSSHAEFVLDKRMADSPKKVLAFMDQLLNAAKPAARRELDELSKFARSLDGPSELQQWDILYYSEKLKEHRFQFNDEQLRPYFKLENVIEGMFELANRLFQIEFVLSSEYPAYHPDVKTYEVFQSRSGRRDFVGLFYADFFPRPSKRSGAWQTVYLGQGLFDGTVVRPHVCIVSNVTKPTPTKPSLLTLDEVRTLFHEFGHALHNLLSQCRYRSLAGTNVFWDFVELPSQILENWVMEKEGLDLFARHYESGESLPNELAQKIGESSKFMSGYYCVRQLSLGYLDMAWHTIEKIPTKSVAEFEIQATEKTNVLPRIPDSNKSVGFSHIFAGGYSMGYYSYKWAEVLDADAFELFKERGLFNKEIAKRFEDFILSRGGSDHPMKLYKEFRGREPDPDALLRRDGLLGGASEKLSANV